jgi:uncharacterized protein YceH (UPF0502 family)
MQLSLEQLRVLGSLIEKEITTPENYPLSLNSLINACNQRSSREPVLDLDEETVRQALHILEDLGLVAPTRDSRVTKYEHRARTLLNLRRDETAILCLLMLRGPQTPGELRSRSDRMFSFDDLASVVATLDRLAGRPIKSETTEAEPGQPATGPLTVLLPRQPGAREARYAHLLGDPAAHETISTLPSRIPPAEGGTNQNQFDRRILDLETEATHLRSLIIALEARILALETEQHSHADASPL